MEVWWKPNQDTIVAIVPYRVASPPRIPFVPGTMTLRFALLKCGMTAFPGEVHAVLSRGAEPEQAG
jgi:hypothetical protein